MNNLNISAWNIAGCKMRYGSCSISKFDFTDFTDLLTDDIICLLETHAGQTDNMELHGYSTHTIHRLHKQKQGRNSGGMAVLIKDNIKHKINWINCNSSEYTMLKIQNADIDTGQDLYIIFAYVSPPNSTYSAEEEVLTQITNTISEIKNKGKYLILGDLNGYTNIDPDYVTQDESRENVEGVPLPLDYVGDEPLPQRNNKDKRATNNRGKEILELCIACNGRILNGRKLGDIRGNYTCFSHRADTPSVIDYAIADSRLYEHVTTFSISHFTPFSDHSKITVNLNVNLNKKNKGHRSTPTLHNLPDKFTWAPECARPYREALNDTDAQVIIENIENFNYTENEEGVNKAVSDLESVIKMAAAKANVKVKTFSSKRKKTKPYPKIINLDCFKLIREIKSLCRKISKHNDSRETRHLYYSKKRTLKKRIKQNEKIMRRKLTSRLEELHDEDPEEYWKTLKELNELNNIPSQMDASSCIDVDIWLRHFKGLLNKLGSRNQTNGLSETIKQLRVHNTFNTLDYTITGEEIQKVIKKTKNNKAGGPDSIIYEMLKHGQQILLKAITKIFNKILSGGKFPIAWSVCMIKPLFKGNGSKYDPMNYRGISLMSCMGKIMCSVLNNRLVHHFETRKELHKSQIGFRKGVQNN